MPVDDGTGPHHSSLIISSNLIPHVHSAGLLDVEYFTAYIIEQWADNDDS